ncbi:hypothetical protein TSAR_002114 [Trichomalopsis sarcophagae]|uniref:Uncharacterized protein n=1 Tax=Trichomalopsis sarcophagae TaxID=543379 RepID=A0A232FFS8_9HYME|nr:hypothetical protein TSAR_002114 [Trichomalopsis sarcophagae]
MKLVGGASLDKLENETNIANITAYFDSKLFEYDLSTIQPIIIARNAWLNDDSIDAFLNIVQEEHPQFKVHAQGNDVLDNKMVIQYAYMIPNYTGGKPVKQEKHYILQRFPSILECDINFVDIVTKQPDRYECGVYSAALLTCLILGGDPSKILQCRRVTPFPIAATGHN